MKKGFGVLFFIICMAAYCFPLRALADETHEISGAVLSAARSPVLLKYIAAENNCAVITDERSKTVIISNKNGETLKEYEGLSFINGQPVIEAGIIQSDMGWTVCLHAPNTDMFDTEADAAAAGAFKSLKASENASLTYYVGRCYLGWHFSGAPGEHEKKCPHPFNKSMIKEFPVKIENGVLYYEIPGNTVYTEEETTFANRNNPVLLEYILRKCGSRYVYSAEDGKVSVYGKNGGLMTSFKDVTRLYGYLAAPAAVLSRAGFSDAHEPNTDLFDTETDALTAGWLKYSHESGEEEFTFYIGNCYGGYYFSPAAGEHIKNCEHKYNVSMFYEKPASIVNGALIYEGKTLRDISSAEFAGYAEKSGNIKEDKPAESLTKMVTLLHTEYAKPEGVQTIYFSYRDRVYRNYWEDVANYDVTDYIFIPPDLPKLDNYDAFNQKAAKEMSEAVLSLLPFDSDAKIWLGTPGITSENYNHKGITAEVSADFLNKVRSGLRSVEIWDKNVAGIYINQESIYPEGEKEQIARIKETVELVKRTNKEKKTLWIPYYDLNEGSSEISGRIAEVARIPALFDFIVIQPGYFFYERVNGVATPDTTAHRRQNLDAVRLSAENNYISNAAGKPVGGNTANAVIGFEMEPQASYFSNNSPTRDESIDRYAQYLLVGAKVKEASPIVYYASGDPHCNKETLIYKFYGADELSAEAVRKKLDYSLNEFYGYVFRTREKEKTFYEYAKRLYLEADAENTEEGFAKAYNAGIVIPEFYKYEKRMNIGDMEEYIVQNGSPSAFFDERILSLMSQ